MCSIKACGPLPTRGWADEPITATVSALAREDGVHMAAQSLPGCPAPRHARSHSPPELGLGSRPYVRAANDARRRVRRPLSRDAVPAPCKSFSGFLPWLAFASPGELPRDSLARHALRLHGDRGPCGPTTNHGASAA